MIGQMMDLLTEIKQGIITNVQQLRTKKEQLHGDLHKHFRNQVEAEDGGTVPEAVQKTVEQIMSSI